MRSETAGSAFELSPAVCHRQQVVATRNRMRGGMGVGRRVRAVASPDADSGSVVEVSPRVLGPNRALVSVCSE